MHFAFEHEYRQLPHGSPSGPKLWIVELSLVELCEIAGTKGPLHEDAKRMLDKLGYDVYGNKAAKS